MTAIARTVYRARKQATEWWGLIVVAGFAYLLAMGLFSAKRLWAGDLLVLTGLSIYAATLVRAVARELGPVTGEGSRRRIGAAATVEAGHELELGMLLVTGVYILVVATGGLGSFLYPLVYALVSFLLIVNKRRWVAGACLGATVVFELVTGLASARAGLVGAWATVALHLTYLGFFAAGNLLILTNLAKRLRGQHEHSISSELARIRQEARDFRLIASQLPLASRAARSREDEELRMAQGAVHHVHEQLFFTIDLLCVSLELHTAALLWVQDDSDERAPGERKDSRKTAKLVIKEMATASEMARDNPVIDAPGVLAAVIRDPKPLRLKALGGRRLPPYYQGPEPVTDLCVVPLTDGKAVRGYLCADRIDDRPFTDQEQDALEKAGAQCMRIIEQERAFAAVERGKYEQEQFYRASELLNQALTLDDVYAKTFAALSAMAPYDLAVITRHDAGAGSGRHEVLAVRHAAQDSDPESWDKDAQYWAELAAGLEGKRFADGSHAPPVAFDDQARREGEPALPGPADDNVLDLCIDREQAVVEVRFAAGLFRDDGGRETAAAQIVL